MEKDRLVLDNILFSDFSTLHTTDGQNTYTSYDFRTTADARISGFVQMSTVEIIFADQQNSCLRRFNRAEGSVYNFSGDCGQAGFRDGTDSLFDRPVSVIQDNRSPHVLYVTDKKNLAVRMITMSNKPYVTTLIRGNLGRLKYYAGMTQDSEGKYLYITYQAGLERFDLVANTSIDIISKRVGFGVQALLYDRNIGTIRDVVIYKRFIIMADKKRHVLVAVDTAGNSSSTICTGLRNSSYCHVDHPFSLLEVDGDLYVGGYRDISVLRGNTNYLIHLVNNLKMSFAERHGGAISFIQLQGKFPISVLVGEHSWIDC